jgi:S1-C subfamily serine protease
MSRPLLSAALVVLLGSVHAARADSLALQMELEGSLAESKQDLLLTVEGEGAWVLEADPATRAELGKLLRDQPGVKVFVRGAVRVRTQGNTLQLPGRTVRVLGYGRLMAAFKVGTIYRDFPAAEHLRIGDLLLEVGGKAITSRDRLLEVLGSQRGKAVNLVVEREGKVLLIENVRLRSESPILGVDGETIWLSPGQGAAPSPESGVPKAAPEKGPEKVPPPKP